MLIRNLKNNLSLCIFLLLILPFLSSCTHSNNETKGKNDIEQDDTQNNNNKNQDINNETLVRAKLLKSLFNNWINIIETHSSNELHQSNDGVTNAVVFGILIESELSVKNIENLIWLYEKFDFYKNNINHDQEMIELSKEFLEKEK